MHASISLQVWSKLPNCTLHSTALAIVPQVRDLLEGLSDRLAAQQELLLRLEVGSGPAAEGSSGSAGAEALVARRDLLAQALEKLQVGGAAAAAAEAILGGHQTFRCHCTGCMQAACVHALQYLQQCWTYVLPTAALMSAACCLSALPQALKAENEGLWASLEGHLSSAEGSSSSASGSGRPNQYLAHLEAERRQLAAQLAAARQEHGEASSRLAAAHAAIAKLQAVVQRLSAAGGVEAGSELRGLLSPLPAGASSQPAAPSPSAGAVSGGASGSAGLEAELQWQAEKRLLKAICKLALAVTMDQVGGRQEAAALADELAPLMAAHSGTLQQLGLQKVWASLHRLAMAGGARGTPSRGTPSQASAPPPAQQQQAQQAQHQQQQQVVVAAAPVEPAVQLPQDVWALQQRVRQYKAKCKELKVRAAGRAC